MAPTVRDSAGVRIVDSGVPAWHLGDAWSVAADPVIDIRIPGAGETGPGPVRGVIRLDDGGIVVATAGDEKLRFFDAASTLERVIGPDDAKARLTAIAALERVGELLHVSQRAKQPTLVFDLKGRYVRSLVPDSLDRLPFVSSFWPLADGSFLLFSSPHGLIPRREPWTEPGQFLRVGAGASSRRILSLPGARLARVPSGVERVVFSPILQFVVKDERIWAAFPDGYSIGVYDAEGVLQRVIRRAWDPEPVTTEQRDRVREQLRAGIEAVLAATPEPLRDERDRSLPDSIAFAETHPAHGRMLIDASGNLWIEPDDPDRELQPAGRLPAAERPLAWDVFDAGGRWLGAVDMPARFHATGIAADAVTGVWRDADGAEHARVYRLHKPGSPRA
ncbi:MAG: hypothetical protein L0271_00110 [Gemmatimonadetes bacterium]|nr:hypothetical protein [Gemmatimonadota bacterium]